MMRRRQITQSAVANQRRHKPDYQIILSVGLLMLFGLIIMYAIGPQRANVLNAAHNTSYYTDTYFVLKQTFSLVLAIVAFIALSVIPFARMREKAGTILAIGFILCALLVVAGNLLHIDAIAKCTLGACRWFQLGPFGSFQPAEFLKFGMLLYIAGFLGVRYKEGKLDDIQQTILPVSLMTLSALFFIVILQKDMGTGIALTSTVASILVVSGIKAKTLGALALAGIAFIVSMILIAPHRMERIVTFIQGDDHSSVEAEDNNYHIKNAKIALGTGGLFGLGIGNSIQATGYLPEAINDSVFAIIGETFGFVGVVIVLVFFTVLLMRLLKITERLPDMTSRLVVAGAFGWLGSHVILNVASMIGVFPLTGITLPLLSFGGTSMLFIAGVLGLVFQLSRYTTHEPVNITKEASYETARSGRRVRGARYPSRRSN